MSRSTLTWAGATALIAPGDCIFTAKVDHGNELTPPVDFSRRLLITGGHGHYLTQAALGNNPRALRRTRQEYATT